jgi:heme A synthase
MYVGAALSLLSVSFLLAGRGKIRDELANKNPDWTRSEVNNAANAVVVVGTIITLLAVAMWLWMAAKNKKGRPWARVVATVLGGFSILFAALSVRTSGSAVTLVFNLVSIALAAVILWFLYRPDSNQYYTATSRAL